MTVCSEHAECISEVRKKTNRFEGLTEDEVMLKTLPDHLTFGLDIVIVRASLCSLLSYASTVKYRCNEHLGYAGFGYYKQHLVVP